MNKGFINDWLWEFMHWYWDIKNLYWVLRKKTDLEKVLNCLQEALDALDPMNVEEHIYETLKEDERLEIDTSYARVNVKAAFKQLNQIMNYKNG